jgi:hypothetical protein
MRRLLSPGPPNYATQESYKSKLDREPPKSNLSKYTVELLRMCFHRHRVVVVASSCQSVIEEEESLSNCKYLCVDTLSDLAIAMAFDVDLHDSLKTVKKQSACRSRPALRRNVQLLDTLLCFDIYIVTDD